MEPVGRSGALCEVLLSRTSDTWRAYQGRVGVSNRATGEYTGKGGIGGLGVSDLGIREWVVCCGVSAENLVEHSLLWGADGSCWGLLAFLLLNSLPHPEAVNQCASGWPASEVGRTLDSWFR